MSVGLALVQLGSAWLCESSQPAALLSVNTSQSDDRDSAAQRQTHTGQTSRSECRDDVADCYVEMREDSAVDRPVSARFRSSR